MGGGNHYTHGNFKLFEKTKAKIGNKALLMTENNNENYIGYADFYLSIFALGRESNTSLQFMQSIESNL